MMNDEKIIGAIKKITEAVDSISLYEFKYYIERLEEFKTGLFSFSKFKVGDFVYLKETPVINNQIAWGWLGYKDILIKGAIGKIDSLDYYKGKFRYNLFIREKGTFCFNEDQLEKIEDVCERCGK